MKKIFLSLFIFIVSIEYIISIRAFALVPHSASTSEQVAIQNSRDSAMFDTSKGMALPIEEAQPVVLSSTTPMATPKRAPMFAPSPKGMYTDGVYTGRAVNAYYGTVQVEVTVQGERLISVTFLQYPAGRSTSEYINSIAMPQLKSEAIKAQSAKVSGVSGASYTSSAFKKSLAGALNQAKNI